MASDIKASIGHLCQNEESFRLLVESVEDYAIYMLDIQGLVVSWNAGAERIKGYGAQDIIGRHFSCFFTAEAIEEKLPELELQQAASEGRFEGEGWRVRADGSRFWANVTVTALRNECGELRGFAKVTRDVTERKQAEAALRQANEVLELRVQERTARLKNVIHKLKAEIVFRQEVEMQLRESEERLRGIFDQAAVGISQVATDGRWLLVNQRLCDIVGYSREEMLASRFQDITHPDDLEADLHSKGQMLAGNLLNYSMEKRYIRKNGSVVWATLTVSLVRRPSGEPKYFISVVEDITERKQAEEALRQKTSQLEKTLHELRSTQAQLVHSEKMSGLGQLVAGIAHEINNPIGFIFGNLDHAGYYMHDMLELLKMYQFHYPQPLPEIQKACEEIDIEFIRADAPKLLASMKQGADRIRQIVLSLRNFSRHDEAELKSVNIHEGIESALLILQHRLQPQANWSGIEVVKNFGKLPKVQCYAGSLNQVFMNILTNAIEALENWGKKRIITIRTFLREKTGEESNSQVIISIKDTGQGMSEDVLKRLFDPFFTTKPVGSGTGLGLSISHQIVVEQHGGQISCISEPGKGAEFVIEIPLQPCGLSTSV
ncbi:PAS domain S-box protein [Ancylothrix sp. C2]|uniref:PAS domain-containing sensor histidine kinase n=1 Tax=Ancylothrix sp. D3o TaxID=2953691 RepID=UPI0021BB33FA|nr:PAS domain S-box protein [Ancylothrix sp. D3o]MCT7951743.1 PAS domain S-box protein [Ancylothrix sp. D3o]